MQNEIYVRSNVNGHYLETGGRWSVRRNNARKFLTVSEARDWCVQEGLVNVEIVVVRDALVCMRVALAESV